MPRSLIASIATPLLVPVITGCTAPQPSVQAQRERLAWSAGDTAAQARLVDEYVGKSFVATSEKSAILARSAILATHATDLSRRIAEFKDDGSQAAASTLIDLQARADGLAEERRALEREWDIWQVQQGLKTAGDARFIYQPKGPDC